MGFAIIAVLVVAGVGLFIWGHRHGVDAAAAAALKMSATAAVSKEVAGAVASVNAEVAKVEQKVTSA
ncbi:MAG: hypothetical protein KGI71_05200 [Patescibacteria group bacterium]|nr:hypothetical protein [Patescibacteria group bacterium]